MFYTQTPSIRLYKTRDWWEKEIKGLASRSSLILTHN